MTASCSQEAIEDSGFEGNEVYATLPELEDGNVITRSTLVYNPDENKVHFSWEDGDKIGVFAVCPKLEGLVSAKNCPGVKYLDPAQVALETATMLKQEKKCDMVICISHLGWNSGRGEDDQYMIRGSRNIDLVLGGHTHTNMEQMEYENNIDGKPVPADQNTKAAVYVSKIVVDLK